VDERRVIGIPQAELDLMRPAFDDIAARAIRPKSLSPPDASRRGDPMKCHRSHHHWSRSILAAFRLAVHGLDDVAALTHPP
jgi:hypothetical protein